MATPMKDGERIASLEAITATMSEGIKELKKTVEDGFKEVRTSFERTGKQIEGTNRSIADLDSKYLTIKDFAEHEKNLAERLAAQTLRNSEKQEEIKKIATTRLWQAVALTALLFTVLTFLATYFLTNVSK